MADVPGVVISGNKTRKKKVNHYLIKDRIMSVVFVLVLIGILVASVFLIAFIWAVRSGQFDDSYTPSVRVLFDDHIHKEEITTSTTKAEKKST